MSSQASASIKFDDLVSMVRAFAPAFRTYLSLDEESRGEIERMLEYAADPDADDMDVDSYYATIADALFPDLSAEQGVQAVEVPEVGHESVAAEMDREEETFASRVAIQMVLQGKTQADLAHAVGVGQPAISLMLSRQARPQRRTVEKFALALGVSIGDLWPSYAPPQDVPRSSHPVRWTGWSLETPTRVAESSVPPTHRDSQTWTSAALGLSLAELSPATGRPDFPLKGAA